MKPMDRMRVSNSCANLYLATMRLTNHTVWIRHKLGVRIVNTKALKEQPHPQTYIFALKSDKIYWLLMRNPLREFDRRSEDFSNSGGVSRLCIWYCAVALRIYL